MKGLLRREWLPIIILSVLVSSLLRITDWVAGYSFGVGNYLIFVGAFCFAMVLGILAEIIWWYVMTSIKGGN